MSFNLGSVSHGTLKTDDLLLSFAYELEGRGRARGVDNGELIASARIYAGMVEEDLLNENGIAAATELVEELSEALNDLCPEYVHFGTHAGDGSDFGFWPNIESLEEDARSGEVLKVNDLADIPEDYAGLVMSVTDHGNVTLWSRYKNKENDHTLTEIWSCV